jgi:Heterokaryon incompatibility protein (HET)
MSLAQSKTDIINKEEYESIFNSEGEYIGYPIYQLTIDWAGDLGDPPTWTEATAQYATSVNLCKRCSEFDLRELFKRYDKDASVPESDAFEISLGEIHSMVQNECGFCQFLVQVAAYLWRSEGLPSDVLCTLKRAAGPTYKCTIFSVNCTSSQLPGFDRSTNPVRETELTLWRDDPRDAEGSLRPRFCPGGTPAKPWQPLTMVAILAQLCVNQHPKCRQQAGLGLRMKTRLFVIDLNELTLIPAPQDCQYVALSYVWGSQSGNAEIRPIKLSTEKNIPLPTEIPTTIIHAMNIAKQFGFEYFWVDQLCIPEDARDGQIAEMDLVYQNATITLVAAVENAESGLPGVGALDRRRNVPVVLEVGGVNIGIRTPMLVSHAISDEVWETRGWTYQEKVLSSRQLVFTEHEVYYKCLEGEKGEESCHQSNTIQFTRDSLFTWGELLSVAHGRVAWQIYGDCVGVYTKRKLTFESDVLHAFKGITSYFTYKYDWTFCWGLPDDNFALSLLWTNTTTTRRETGTISFPSWSWAGWVGRASYDGFRPKELVQAESLDSFKDFVPASWKPGMLGEAAQSGILTLDAECKDINEANCGLFKEPLSWGSLQAFEDNKDINGCVFIGVVALSDTKAPPYVRGLIAKSEGNVAYRVCTAGIDLEKWLGMSRELRSISIA